MQPLVPKVLKVFLLDNPDEVPLDVDNPYYKITAVGEVPANGWSHARVLRDGTDQQDGIFGFNFVATPPDDTSVVTPPLKFFVSSLPFRIADPDVPFRGVRVQGADNAITVRLPTAASEPYPTGDQISISQATIEAGQLLIDVAYAGGCRRHGFDLFWDGHLPHPTSPHVCFRLVHRANADPCEMLVRETLQFPLPEIRPSAIELSTAFGFSVVIANPYSPSPPMFPGSTVGIPIIDRRFATFLFKVLTDQQLQES